MRLMSPALLNALSAPKSFGFQRASHSGTIMRLFICSSKTSLRPSLCLKGTATTARPLRWTPEFTMTPTMSPLHASAFASRVLETSSSSSSSPSGASSVPGSLIESKKWKKLATGSSFVTTRFWPAFFPRFDFCVFLTSRWQRFADAFFQEISVPSIFSSSGWPLASIKFGILYDFLSTASEKCGFSENSNSSEKPRRSSSSTQRTSTRYLSASMSPSSRKCWNASCRPHAESQKSGTPVSGLAASSAVPARATVSLSASDSVGSSSPRTTLDRSSKIGLILLAYFASSAARSLA
mmetsp:Transcript_34795/g.106890  ORF Transcript_34795/g.106890 Transcript_34795/m.106890 type:complete len:295 (-) Transcript_34795:216-1100(-)